MKSVRYYWIFFIFRLKEPFTDFRASFLTYLLYAFFVGILSKLWTRFNAGSAAYGWAEIIAYIGITEMLFMTFLSTRQIIRATEDFSLCLARPRSWILREVVANIGSAFGRRLCFVGTLVIILMAAGAAPESWSNFLFRIFGMIILLAPTQSLLSALFSSLRLSFSQTDYFILPFSKLFLGIGGVLGPISEFGEPWRGLFLSLPGSDLFFQPTYFILKGTFYSMNFEVWFLRIVIINTFLTAALLFSYRQGRRNFQSWGG